MSETFFETLTDCLARSGSRSGSVDLDPAVWAEFTAASARPAAPIPPPAAPAPAPIRAAVAEPIARPVAPPAPAAPAPAPVARPNIASADWEQLAAAVYHCNRCRLCERRTNTVFGEGDPRAELMFVGEGPGRDEDLTGRPFVGKAGQLLDKMIAAMTYRREEVYIANVVKCRPPDNRVPAPDEALECIGYLRAQIKLVNPKVIVSLGGTALTFLLGETVGIKRMRGNWVHFEGIPVMPTFHPAYLLRSPEEKRFAWHDLQEVMRALGRLK